MSESLWSALVDERFSEVPVTLLESLVEESVLVDRSEDEVSAVIKENQSAIGADKLLYHVIQPTAACQLGCGYCGQEHSAHLLSQVEQGRLLERLRTRMATRQYVALSISWFGAEPLLGLPVMRELSPKLNALAAEHQASYSSKIVTNGVRLTAEVAWELVEIHSVVEAEITLDGPPKIHDSRRATKSGRPSFGVIFSNIIAISKQPEIDLGLVVRCNVDRQNVSHVSELIDLLADAGLHDRISFYVSPVYSWGNDADIAAIPLDEFGQWEIEWFAHLHNRGFKFGLLPHRRKIVCLAVRKEGELTDAFGNVFNCTEVSYVPTYGNPNRYAINGSGLTKSREAPFRRFNEEVLNGQHSMCRACSMLPVCGGSCPKLWSEGKVPCPSTKSNIRERLALWYAIQKQTSRLPLNEKSSVVADHLTA